MTYRLVVTIVNRGFESAVMDAAREAGATGGTLVNARGAGAHEAEKLFGVAVSPEKGIVLILSAEEKCDAIMKSVIAKAGLNTLGAGICFSMPVDDVLGVALGINE